MCYPNALQKKLQASEVATFRVNNALLPLFSFSEILKLSEFRPIKFGGVLEQFVFPSDGPNNVSYSTFYTPYKDCISSYNLHRPHLLWNIPTFIICILGGRTFITVYVGGRNGGLNGVWILNHLNFAEESNS